MVEADAAELVYVTIMCKSQVRVGSTHSEEIRSYYLTETETKTRTDMKSSIVNMASENAKLKSAT